MARRGAEPLAQEWTAKTGSSGRRWRKSASWRAPKCILVEYLRMSEQQAHRYIEKQAMDMRTSKRNIAENILKNVQLIPAGV